jgi:hypothetical protein
MVKPREPQGRFIRWQQITLNQMGHAINLIHVSAVATLGFGMSILRDKHVRLHGLSHCLFLFGTVLLLVSVAVGIWCVINRLWDFRATTTVARMSEKNKPKEEIEPYRTLYKKLGKRTWALFYMQIGTFGFGFLFYVVWILSAFCAKLF